MTGRSAFEASSLLQGPSETLVNIMVVTLNKSSTSTAHMLKNFS